MSKTKDDNAALLRRIADRKAEKQAAKRSAQATHIGLLVGHDELEGWEREQQRKAQKKGKR